MSARSLVRSVLLGAAITSCAFALGGVATAAAAPAAGRPEPVSFEAQLPPSDGYTVFLRGAGPDHIELDLATEAEEGPLVTMTYRTTGVLERHRIEADFGRFGHVALHFTGPPKRSSVGSPFCEPVKPGVIESGAMSGSVEFDSLGGTVEFAVTEVEAETTHGGIGPCKPKPGVTFGPESPPTEKRARRAPESEAPAWTFLARAHRTGRTIDLSADKVAGLVVDVAATSTRRIGAVLVSTSVHGPYAPARPGEAATLSILGAPPRPASARLTAAGAFSGSATYRKRIGAPPSWLGSLRVRIPGEGTLPLAGPDFRAILCGYGPVRLERACEGTVAPPHTV